MEIHYKDGYAFIDGYKFRRDTKTGYYLSTKKIGNSRIRLHRYVWEKHNGAIPKGFEVHHKDNNKDNNELNNLELLSKSSHAKHHMNNPTELQKDTIHNNKMFKAQEKAVEWHKSEEGRAWHSEHAKKVYANLKYKTYTCKHCASKFKSKKQDGVKFCSPSCQSAFRVKSGVDNELRVCEICSTKFSINKHRKTKTCSRSCASKLARQNNKREV
ncbi:HNH endonuclease [Bacillus paranthracis]|uniref:HNH endonuclease n=1 Tax=Bacillus paranthracis TaxID=2026186 RepID=UPI00288F39E9|nr:HNH endonuclease [Bacillus thuringiensis]